MCFVELRISHEISSYYEDAYNATAEMQPNIFGRMHTFTDKEKDNGYVHLIIRKQMKIIVTDSQLDGWLIALLLDKKNINFYSFSQTASHLLSGMTGMEYLIQLKP